MYRVPGNFHVEMRSKNHNINPPMANLSLVVNSLTFGPPIERKMERRINSIPDEYFTMKNTRPMDGNYYVNDQLHKAFHHYIKVRNLCCCVFLCPNMREISRVHKRMNVLFLSTLTFVFLLNLQCMYLYGLVFSSFSFLTLFLHNHRWCPRRLK